MYVNLFEKRWLDHGLLVITGWQVASLVCLAPILARGHESRFPESPSAPTGLEGSEMPWVAYSSGSAACCLLSSWLLARAGLETSQWQQNWVSLLWGCESGEDLTGPGRLQQWEVWGDTLKRPLGAAITFHAGSFCVSLDSVTKQGAREQWFYHRPVAICWSWTCFATVYSPPRLNISHPVPLNW